MTRVKQITGWRLQQGAGGCPMIIDAATLMQLDRQTAIRRLVNRWYEQCEMFPRMRDEIPLSVYVRTNLPHVLRSWRSVAGIQLKGLNRKGKTDDLCRDCACDLHCGRLSYLCTFHLKGAN